MAQRTIDQDVGGDPHHNPDPRFLDRDYDRDQEIILKDSVFTVAIPIDRLE